MKRFFKTLMLWLLVAMLPLHAVGASMPMSCMPVHHQRMQHILHDNAPQGHGEHHRHETDMTAHDHHDAGQVHHVSSDDGAADGSASSVQSHAGCSACAAGCIGAAAPPVAVMHTMPAFIGSEAVLVVPIPLVTGYTPDGLERPPKYILA
ncbi:hypothetical protein EDC30_11854 [Paucimonas lemoignei]|uniref:DUF2946 domain-containing protein n=1 Tax=Paucimonas lemoignei TaxID=29443 RepID=A0A4R3HP87_PAULE|nr:hypothetical protein [Paucimonas lemoignei]TCS33113.1 hypothetical protein EDC30_11854 [Paucimonas lemoignei]